MILSRIQVLVLGLCLAAPAALGGETVHGLVEAGKRLFAEGKFDEAQAKFAAAEVKAPENPIIAYNRALAYQAAGNVTQAEAYYRKADYSRDADLNARTTFNLGTLRVMKARALLGEDPAKVGKEAREAILDHLEAAVARFRTVLEARPKDPDARYNIEVIRLWVKDMTDRWRKADREKARNEADLVKYLEYLMNAQEALKDETEALEEREDPASGRPVRLEQVIRVQEELGDEIPHLKDKVKAFIQKVAEKTAAPGAPGAAAPKADPKQLEKLTQAEAQLTALADRAGKAMDEAVLALGDLALDRAAASQSTAHDRLLDMWKGLADFMAILARAIRGQDAVIAGTEPYCEEAAQEEARAEEIEAAKRLQKDQVEVRDLVPLLTVRAQGMKSQLQKAPTPKPGEQPPGQPSPQEIVKAFDKALELLPDADAAMEAAVRAVGDRSWKTGLEEEKKAAEILKKIRDLFKNQKKDEQKKQDQKKNDSKKKDEPKKDEQKKQPRDPKKMTQEEADRQLQKMREKRKKREKKRHAEAAARRPRVEKDW